MRSTWLYCCRIDMWSPGAINQTNKHWHYFVLWEVYAQHTNVPTPSLSMTASLTITCVSVWRNWTVIHSVQLPINCIYNKIWDLKMYLPFGDIFSIISFASSGETAVIRTHFSALDWRVGSAVVRFFSFFNTKTFINNHKVQGTRQAYIKNAKTLQKATITECITECVSTNKRCLQKLSHINWY